MWHDKATVKQSVYSCRQTISVLGGNGEVEGASHSLTIEGEIRSEGGTCCMEKL